MPVVPVSVSVVPGDNGYSETQYKGGLLEEVDVRYDEDVDDALFVEIQVLLNPEADEEDQIWSWRWHTPFTSSNDVYYPTATTTLKDGSAGSSEVRIPLRNPWRVVVAGNATAGTVSVYVSLDQA